MADIDLIPTRYRKHVLVSTWLRRIALVIVALVVSIGLARVGIAQAIRSETQELESLRVARRAAIAQKNRILELRAEKADLGRRQRILEGLRGAIPARDMFLAIDRSLDANVWFSNWEFRRAGELVDAKQTPERVATGYLLVIPAQGKDEPEKAWRMETHMEIGALALDHASLAGFVRRLVAQPEVDDVRVLNTRVRTQDSLVEFQLAVVVVSRA